MNALKKLSAFFRSDKEKKFEELVNLAVEIKKPNIIEDYLEKSETLSQRETRTLVSAIVENNGFFIKVSVPLLKAFLQFKGSEDEGKKLNKLYLKRIMDFFSNDYLWDYSLNSFSENLSIIFSLPVSFDETKKTLIKKLVTTELKVKYCYESKIEETSVYCCLTQKMEEYLIKKVKEENISYRILYSYLSNIGRDICFAKTTGDMRDGLPYGGRKISGLESEMIILLLDSGYTDLYEAILFLKEKQAVSPLLEKKLQSFKVNADKRLQELYALYFF